MRNLLLILILIFVLFSEKLYTQVAVSYYPFESVVSLSTDTESLFWADLRVGSNTFFSNINVEFDAMINIKRTDWVNYYTGLGINLNPFYGLDDVPITNGYVFNAGVRVKPIQKYRKFQVVFEISPISNTDFDGGVFRTLLGVSYNL